MNMVDTRLSALLGSRICHDLISPLGAIGNGVELLQMSGLGDSPELSLISESVEHANARIRLFRVAFGAPSPEQHIARSEVQSVLAPISSARKLDIAWDPPADMPRDLARLVFLLLLCCETALPYGGAIAVDATGDTLHISAEAPRLRQTPELWAHMSRADLPMPLASDIHFPLARQAATDIGRRIEVVTGDTRIDIHA
ncbi:histidine phosphotransferase [Maribius pontilimi]|uniref:Histidine phosphotransferase n=1 Tax=Palleronia pontilimi TaxID=1964209 RepID=A0A934MCJ6_9RHOB|nr:histidine phosphotransferase family protein [Palleronia pontilimi]MBJ3762858.1 histidine phosphotransferase [Palleronia pontilimi]